MKWIRERVQAGELLSGTWLNLGSIVTAEIASRAGFDWVLIDLEHGAGSDADLVGQLQAVECGGASAIVRVAWNDSVRFKRALDMGPAGIMVPYVNTAAEAFHAARAMRYPPDGNRGAARFHRANRYGQQFDAYMAHANGNLLTVVQVETAEAVRNADEIAAVEGVDVLFIGPLDLSVSLGIMGQVDHPDFRAAVRKVVEACRAHDKAAGILLPNADRIPAAVEDGFRFLAAGSDGTVVAAGMNAIRDAFLAASSRSTSTYELPKD